MQPFQILINPTNALHLYRHLLREASYLPPVAQPWVRNYIAARFRRHQSVPLSYETKCRRLSLKAYKALRNLRAAVQGDIKRLRRVMFLVFGRKGVRRRQLVDDLIKSGMDALETGTGALTTTPQGKVVHSTSTGSLDEMLRRRQDVLIRRLVGPPLARSGRARRVASIDMWNLGIIEKLARSQAASVSSQHGGFLESTMMKNPVPKYEELDVWGRPKSARRRRYLDARMWKVIANRLLPPLADDEWSLLQRLSTDSSHVDPLLKIPTERRKLAVALVPLTEEDISRFSKIDKTRPYDWRETLTMRVDLLERQRNRHMRVVSGATDDGDPKGTQLSKRAMTPRMLRRILHLVWSLTPKFVAVTTPKGEPKLDIVWGGKDTEKSAVVRSPAAVSLFFSGVDTKGRRVENATTTPSVHTAG